MGPVPRPPRQLFQPRHAIPPVSIHPLVRARARDAVNLGRHRHAHPTIDVPHQGFFRTHRTPPRHPTPPDASCVESSMSSVSCPRCLRSVPSYAGFADGPTFSRSRSNPQIAFASLVQRSFGARMRPPRGARANHVFTENEAMRIGVPAEIKNNEYRVGMTPSGAQDLTSDGHTVYIQAGAGYGSGFSDEEYAANGAKILATADDVYQQSDMIVKVKEPIDADLARLKDGQLLFTYLHLAPVPDLTASLLKKKITGIAYETITDERKRTLPLLTPMSEVAGRMSVHVG